MTPAIRAFLRAASDGDANLVKGLLAQGTDVNSTNRAGQTALMLAAGFKRHGVVQILIAAGADVEIQDDLGLSATDWAKDDPELIELLARKDSTEAEPDQPNPTPRVEEEKIKPEPVVAPVVERQAEGPKLKGLAGAILRDHKPRLEERVQPIGSVPAQLRIPHQEPESLSRDPHREVKEPAVVSPNEPEVVGVAVEEPASIAQPDPTPVSPERRQAARITQREPEQPLPPPPIEDETLDRPGRALTEDTAAPRPSIASRSRIFDLTGATETRPLSKVEVSVPEAKSGSRVFVWVLLLVLLAAAGLGAYLVTRRLLTRPSTATTEVVTPQPEASQAATVTKRPPVVSGDLAGAELHVPDAVYPADAQGRSGTVRVGVQVSQKGIVFVAKALDGDDLFRGPAEKAAKASAFLPDKLHNTAGKTEGTITYTFAPGQSTPDKHERGVTAVAGGPLSGAELDLVEPQFSSRAKDSGAGGEFTIVVRVNRAGHVMSWRTLNGDSRLRDAVVKAARRSTFAPNKLPGSGEVVGTITYTFN